MSIYSIEPDINSSFKVVENKTGHLIKTEVPYSVAKSVSSFLNSGFGFNGWTPEFLLVHIPSTS